MTLIGLVRRILIDDVDPIEEFISSLESKHAEKILDHLEFLDEMRLRIGPPYVKQLQNCDLWEFRVHYRRNQYRILFFEYEGLIILLHGFQYKDKIPRKEIDVALERKNNLLKGLK